MTLTDNYFQLNEDEKIKHHLSNKYLRNIMTDLVADRSDNDIRFLMDRAMQEPIFSEFAIDAITLMYPELCEQN